MYLKRKIHLYKQVGNNLNHKKMQKYILVSLLIGLLSTNIIFSQNDMRFGINGGLTFSKFRSDESIDKLDIGVNVMTGFLFELIVNENLSIKTNLNYERKSMIKEVRYDGPYDDFDFKTNHTYGYLTLPILFQYKFDKSSNLYFNSGPFIGYLLHRQTKSSSPNKAKLISYYKKFDLGLSVGIGTKIKLDKEVDLGIELRENLGLIDINNIEDEDGTIKTQSVNLILTMEFGI